MDKTRNEDGSKNFSIFKEMQEVRKAAHPNAYAMLPCHKGVQVFCRWQRDSLSRNFGGIWPIPTNETRENLNRKRQCKMQERKCNIH
jgi:hypothetical protein